MRASTPALPYPAVGQGNDGGDAGGAVRRPDRPCLFPDQRLCGIGHRLRRDDVVRIGDQLPAARGAGSRSAELGSAYAGLRRSGWHRPGFGHAGLRILHAGRPAASVGLPRQPVLRPRIRVRPPDVLPAHFPAARHSGQRRLRGRRPPKSDESRTASTASHRQVRCGPDRCFWARTPLPGPPT